jgi:hypothetical protein
LVLGLGLGDMDDSVPLIFWGIGADVGGGNATGVCKKDTGWGKPNFYVRWSNVPNRCSDSLLGEPKVILKT